MPQPPHLRQVENNRNDPTPVPATPATDRARRGAVAWRDGMRAEQAGCDALLADGWTILARRARTAAGEIDIVATCGRLLAFVEVKTRATLALAAGSLSERQRRRLQAAAGILLATHPHWLCDMVRFDVLVVDRDGAVRRIADAFRAEGGDDQDYDSSS